MRRENICVLELMGRNFPIGTASVILRRFKRFLMNAMTKSEFQSI